MSKRLMHVLVVILAIGAMIQTVANAVENKGTPEPKETSGGTSIAREPGI